MTERSKESNKEKVFWKSLGLVTPEYANYKGLVIAGLPTESPAFISPIVQSKEVCRMCHAHYTPLVYGVGHTTVAQHFHEFSSWGGGIYLNKDKPAEIRRRETGWVGFFGPQNVLGPLIDFRIKGLITIKLEGDYRAEQARLLLVKAFCTGCQDDAEELKSGLVVSDDITPNYLFPVCEESFFQGAGIGQKGPVFRFNIAEDGQVLFSNFQ